MRGKRVINDMVSRNYRTANIWNLGGLEGGDVLLKNELNDSGSLSWNLGRLNLAWRLSAVVKAWLSVKFGTGGTFKK